MKIQAKKSSIGLMVAAIFIISLNLRPAISSIGPLLETIRIDLALSNSEVSLLTAVPVFCMGLFAPFAIWFQRKFGVKHSITILLAVIGVFTVLRGIVPSYQVLLISAFFAGLAIAIIGPLLSSMIKRNFPTRTTALIGVYSFGLGFGATLSTGLTGVFYTALDWPFALASWSMLAVTGIILWQRVNQPEQLPLTVEQEVKLDQPPLKSRRAWYMLIFFGIQSSLFYSSITWFAPIAIDRGMTVLSAGAALTLMSAVQLLGNLAIPLVLEKYPSRLVWTLLSLALGITGVLLLLSGGTALIWVAAVLLGLTLGALFPIALLMPLDENSTAEGVNSWTAMIQTGGYVISGMMPFIIGLLYDQFGTHTITLIIFLALLVLLVGISFLLYRKTEVLQ